MISNGSTQPAETSKEENQATDFVIDVKGLCRQFGNNLALDNVALQVPSGVVMGLVGLNGAGKTTLMKHVLGLLRAQQGTVSVFGVDPSRHPEKALAKIGYLTEEDTLPGWMKVWQLLKFSKPFYPNWDDAYADELLEQFKLPTDKPLGKLSKGQRARCGLVVALAHRPELLLLDEPSSGLDPVVRNDILGAIIRTVADSGRTVLFSSHLLDEVQRVSDLIGVMRDGKLVECGTLDSLSTRYQRVTLQMRDPSNNQPPAIESLGKWESSGSEWIGVLDVADESLSEIVDSAGASLVHSEGMSLNEWFLETSR